MLPLAACQVCSLALGTSSPTLTPSEPALLYFPSERQGQLSQVLQLERGRASSPTLMTPGSSLPTVSDVEEQKGKGHVSLFKPLHGRRVVGPGLPLSQLWGMLTPLPLLGLTSTLLHKQGARPILPSAAIINGQVSPTLRTLGPALLTAAGDKG